MTQAALHSFVPVTGGDTGCSTLLDLPQPPEVIQAVLLSLASVTGGICPYYLQWQRLTRQNDTQISPAHLKTTLKTLVKLTEVTWANYRRRSHVNVPSKMVTKYLGVRTLILILYTGHRAMFLSPSKQSVTIRQTQAHLLLLSMTTCFGLHRPSSGHYYETFKIRYKTVQLQCTLLNRTFVTVIITMQNYMKLQKNIGDFVVSWSVAVKCKSSNCMYVILNIKNITYKYIK